MSRKWPAVVVTDLDGTLLDSRTYAFDQAKPAIDALSKREIPVVLVSSKTRSEIEVLREKLDIQDPFIVENGGAAYLPPGYFPDTGGGRDVTGRYEVLCWGVPYEELVAALREVRRETGARLEGFSDVDVEEVARRTGLNLEEARRSIEREYDEPFWMEGKEDSRSQKALELLEARRLTVTRGGRFYHVMGDCDKGKAVRELLRLYGGCPSAGLGDGKNDLPFLLAVDRAYIVAGPEGDHDSELVQAIGDARRVGPAPGGWAEAVTDFLSWLDHRPPTIA
jgi:mannosyl-3-phosphoglycerate phosphatase